jgi:PBSX family phage terminase large subunit
MALPFYPLSDNALDAISDPQWLTVFEGSVRSSKTVVSTIAWINFIFNSPDDQFFMSGNSRGSLYRNVLSGNYGMLKMLGPLANYHGDNVGNRIIDIKTQSGVKKVYLFGATDMRSREPLTGLTSAGWYADEIDKHHPDFIEEAFNRTVVHTGPRKHFWTMNPQNPNHFIYTKYLDDFDKKKKDGILKGYNWWHFTLDDNAAISTEDKQVLESQYRGVFYKRYILGLRIAAEGLVYSELNDENYYYNSERPIGLEYIARRIISVDYGTVHPTVFLNAYDDGNTVWVDDAYVYGSKEEQRQLSPDQYADKLVEFIARDLISEGQRIICDPSALYFFQSCRTRHNIILEKAKNDVYEGILACSSMFNKRKIKINRDSCPDLCNELLAYSWNEKSSLVGKEEPIGIRDDNCDSLRYLIYTAIPEVRYNKM